MDPVSTVKGRIAPIPAQNIDTDTVTPVRFLKMTVRDEKQLAGALFHDWRFNEDGTLKPDFPLNRPEHQGAKILLAGDNFGCGSSREKAPWAVLAYGFRAVVSTSIADIFRSNSLKNGLLPVIVDPSVHRELFDLVAQDPSAEVAIDLASQKISWHRGDDQKTERSATFPIDSFSKKCLLKGVDQLGYLLGFADDIVAFEKTVEKRRG